MAKEFVSCHMAVEVVYFFETVQIHEEKGVGFFAVQFFCCVEDAAVVQEAGEGVMPCHAEGCFFLLRFFRLGQDLEEVGQGDGKDEDQEGPGGQGLHDVNLQGTVGGGDVVLGGIYAGSSGGNKDAPADDEGPDFFFSQGMELVPADEKAGQEDREVKQGQYVIQGEGRPQVQQHGGGEEQKEPLGKPVVNGFSPPFIFRKVKVVKEGGAGRKKREPYSIMAQRLSLGIQKPSI